MIRNYLAVAFRNLKKQKFYSLINILGLSLGLTCVTMISLYVIDELSYDSFQSDVDQIYRMDFDGNINGNNFNTALASPPAAKTMIADFPQVEDATRLRGTGTYIIRPENSDESFKEKEVIYADKNFFSFFDIDLLKGNPETCLEDPKSVVISEDLSRKLFGDVDPIMKKLTLDNDKEVVVTAVYENMPDNMHFHYDMMLPLHSKEEARRNIWMSFNFNTYIKLQEGTDPAQIESQFPALIEKYIGPEVEKFMGQSFEEFQKSGNSTTFSLFPMNKIHLYSDKLGELETNGSIQYVLIFTAVAIFILILACINFMNLATARSAGRAKEVGIRKTMGAYRSNLIKQFLTEAFLITTISILLAIGISYLIMPYFNELAGKNLSPGTLFDPKFVWVFAAVLVVVSLMAGSYPAFYLSKFKPVEVLKGKLSTGMKSGGVRSALVIVQFTVSIIMMIGTYFVFEQLNFMQNKKLGFEKEQIVMVHDTWLLKDNAQAFKTEVLRDNRVKNATLSGFIPIGGQSNNNLWFVGQSAGNSDSYVLSEYYIDHDYIETFEIEIAKGRGFSKDFPNDSNAVLLNEAAVRHLGLEDPLSGYLTTYGGSQENPEANTKKIIGVVEDFHFTNMRQEIPPLVMVLEKSRGYLSVNVKTDDISATVDYLESTWDKFAGGQPFEFSFMNERFNKIYENEQRIGTLFSVFAFLAIFIACLGLYGLAAFTAEQKTKEIGIRKVLGASTMQIIALIGKEFMKLVLIAFIIGSAVGYFGMKEWLNDFAYRVNINNPTGYLITGLVALLIAWVTMSAQSFRAARTNPVNSLKEE